jgi:carbon storage regulator
MLVLTRKPGEQIIIADSIRITVVSVGPGRVKIGIEAPPTVTVDREEVHTRRRLEAMPRPVAVPLVVDSAPALHNRIATRLEAPAEAPEAGTARSFPPRKPR